LEHFKIIALIESSVERWFRQAKVNTCLVILEKCSEPALRALNLVRLIYLKRSLDKLIPCPIDNYRRPQVIEQLATRLLPNSSRETGDFAVSLVPQGELQAGARWGQRLRAPTVCRPWRQQEDLPSLKTWATVQRGFTTGANSFFYLDSATIARWGIESEFRRPVLKSLRGVYQLRLTVGDCQHELLWVPPTADMRHTAVSRYIAWGENQGYHLRRSCATRQPWYTLPSRLSESSQPVGEVTALLLPKGIWRRHFAPLLVDAFAVDQQLYQVSLSAGVSPLAAAAVLNSAWFALQCELQGRVNLGEGVLWLATYEVREVPLPDLRRLSPADSTELARLFTQLEQRPLQESEIELTQPDRQALDAAVFDLLGFSTTERSALVETLLERLHTRQRRARG
jgi:hypothetical protein